MTLRGMLCSNGAKVSRVFVVLAMPPEGPRPRDECERVILTPPEKVRPRIGLTPSSGPRRPDQMKYKEKPPAMQFDWEELAKLRAEWMAKIRRERAEEP